MLLIRVSGWLFPRVLAVVIRFIAYVRTNEYMGSLVRIIDYVLLIITSTILLIK
jgi:hypothetical protein